MQVLQGEQHGQDDLASHKLLVQHATRADEAFEQITLQDSKRHNIGSKALAMWLCKRRWQRTWGRGIEVGSTRQASTVWLLLLTLAHISCTM
jgi:hypothetical protein